MSMMIKKTVNSILASVTKVLKDLEEVEKLSYKGADDAQKVIMQKQAEKQEHLIEGQRAAAVKKKIADLIA